MSLPLTLGSFVSVFLPFFSADSLYCVTESAFRQLDVLHIQENPIKMERKELNQSSYLVTL